MERSALQTAAAVRSGETSARAETEAAIARIEAGDGALNAVVVRDFDRARAAAAALDQRISDGFDAPLLGVPMTVKESFDVAGLPTSWGFAEHADHVADEDAVAVQRLKAAGAIILGKTNVALGLADLQSNNPNYGRTRNPHHPDRVSGGSSGGSAAALAAGFIPLEMGSDIGGSIRVPAAFCGVWGHKPTFGMLDAEGHYFPRTKGAAPNLSVIGPLARDPDDLALALDLTADLPLPRPAPRRLGDWRILVLARHPLAAASADVAGAVEKVGTAFAAAGATVDHQSDLLPDLESQHADYMRILAVAMARGRPGPGGPPSTPMPVLLDRQADCRRAWRRLFRSYDAVIAPAWGTTAFAHDDTPIAERIAVIDGVPTPFGAQIAYPGLATFPLLPATSVPIAVDPNGLPIGVQVIADRYHDHTAIAVARAAHDLVRSQ
ncbi:Amidase [Sphingomonas sp. EC-HK361]|uniref:amidase family protein n=1 Tax=Sphingomonas sp. EC-HK361 TaxID=2038397 RepID=UPI001252197E|nr:amidase family protein [Sphingomonas sp. EC-HK361]VVT04096.1 Amidase [Sphingomonas sp. EC-HK361]